MWWWWLAAVVSPKVFSPASVAGGVCAVHDGGNVVVGGTGAEDSLLAPWSMGLHELLILGPALLEQVIGGLFVVSMLWAYPLCLVSHSSSSSCVVSPMPTMPQMVNSNCGGIMAF